MKYNKLVRDKIPKILKAKKLKVKKHVANDEEYWEKLKEKLQEETDEFLKEDNKHELADIMEVIEAICNFKNIDKKELNKVKKYKAKERGKFKKRIILDEVED
jgi:predicted house-cleaning noncanonical NTP pyrophosphatase (MazG superfamily)